jgi:hypothetical protein
MSRHSPRLNSFFDRQSALQPVQHRVVGNPGLIDPLGYRFGDATRVRNKCRCSAIVGLLFACAPHAIVWAIIAVVVFSVQGVAWRWLGAHIRNEVLNGIQPSVAHFDSTTTISWIVVMIWIQASVSHVKPVAVLGRLLKSMLGVFCSRFADLLDFYTTAALRMPSNQAMRQNVHCSPAFAFTSPCKQWLRPFHDRLSNIDGGESSKFASRKLVGHTMNYTFDSVACVANGGI